MNAVQVHSQPTVGALPSAAADVKRLDGTGIRERPQVRTAPARSRIRHDLVRIFGATLVSQILGAVTSLLLRAFLDPAHMGIWQGLKLYLSYGNYAGLGASKAATREASLARGSGNRHAASRAANLAHSVNTVTSGLYALILLAAGFVLAVRGGSALSTAWAYGLAAVALMTMLQRKITFQVSLLRANQEFSVTSRLTVLESVVTLAAGGLGAWLWGLPGVIVSALLVLLASLWFLRPYQQPLGYAWSWREVRQLVAIGGPLLLAGVASSLYRTLDRLMILAYLPDGEHQLGCYSLALMVTTQLFGMATVIATVLGPRYGELLGRSGNPGVVARTAARSMEFQAVALALPSGLAITIGWPLLGAILPAYGEGLMPLLWLLPATLCVTMTLPGSQFLATVNQGKTSLAAVLAAVVLAAIGNHWALTTGRDVDGVARVTLLTSVAYLVILFGCSLWRHLTWPQRLRCAVLSIVPFIPTVGGAVYWARHWGPQTTLGETWPAALAVCAGWLIMLAVGWYGCGWRTWWREGR